MGYLWGKGRRLLSLVVTVVFLATLFPVGPLGVAPAEAATVTKLTASPSTLNLFVDQSRQVEVTATYSDKSTDTVTDQCEWLSSNEEIVSVSSDGTLTGVAAGKATVTALLEGKKATVKVNVFPAIRQLTVEPEKLVLTRNKTAQLRVYAVYGPRSTEKVDVTRDCTWETGDENVAVVDEKVPGKVTATGRGETYITANYELNAGTVETLRIPVRVVDNIRSLSVPAKTALVTAGESLSFPVTVTYSDGSSDDVSNDVTVSISNKNIVLYQDGSLIGLRAGTAKVTFKYADKTVSASVIVIGGEGNLYFSPSSLPLLKPGDTKKVSVKLSHSGGTVDVTDKCQFSSDNPEVAVIDTTGTIRALQPGVANITASYETQRAVLQVSVTPTIGSLTTNIDSSANNPLLLLKDDAVYNKKLISVTANFADGTQADVTDKVTWSISNKSVARVIPVGGDYYIEALGKGTAVINGNYGNARVTIYVKVIPSINNLVLTDNRLNMKTGEKKQMVVTANFSDGTTGEVTADCIFTSDAPAVVGIEPNGYLVAKGSGQAIVTIYHKLFPSKPVTAIVTVQDPILQMSIFNTEGEIIQNATYGVGVQFNLIAKIKRSALETASWQTLSTGVSWSSTNKSVAVVDETGLVRTVGPGVASIIAKYEDKTASVNVYVDSKYISSVSPSYVKAGEGFDLIIEGVGTSFSNLSRIYLNNQLMTALKEASPNVIRVGIPNSMAEGTYDVKVVTGDETVTKRDALKIVPALAVKSAATAQDPNSGIYNLIEILFNQDIKLSNGKDKAEGNNGFTVDVTNGPAVTVNAIAIKENNSRVLLLILDRPVISGATVKVTYTPGSVKIMARSGEEMAAITSSQPLVVQNGIPDQTPPQMVYAETNTDGTAVIVTFSEAVKLTAPDRKAGFRINGSTSGIISAAVSSENEKKIIINLDPNNKILQPKANVLLSYNRMEGAMNVQDLAGNPLYDIVAFNVVNNTTTSKDGPQNLIINSIELNVDERTLTIKGSNLAASTGSAADYDVDLSKVEVVDADVYNGTAVPLMNSGKSEVKLISPDSEGNDTLIIKMSNPNDDLIQPLAGNNVTINLRRGWFIRGGLPSLDGDLIGRPVTVINEGPADFETTINAADFTGDSVYFDNAQGAVIIGEGCYLPAAGEYDKDVFLDVWFGGADENPNRTNPKPVASTAFAATRFSGTVITGIARQEAGRSIWYRLRDRAGQTTIWIYDGVVPPVPDVTAVGYTGISGEIFNGSKALVNWQPGENARLIAWVSDYPGGRDSTGKLQLQKVGEIESSNLAGLHDTVLISNVANKVKNGQYLFLNITGGDGNASALAEVGRVPPDPDVAELRYSAATNKVTVGNKPVTTDPSVRGLRLYYSTDNGSNWQKAGECAPTQPLAQIVNGELIKDIDTGTQEGIQPIDDGYLLGYTLLIGNNESNIKQKGTVPAEVYTGDFAVDEFGRLLKTSTNAGSVGDKVQLWFREGGSGAWQPVPGAVLSCDAAAGTFSGGQIVPRPKPGNQIAFSRINTDGNESVLSPAETLVGIKDVVVVDPGNVSGDIITLKADSQIIFVFTGDVTLKNSDPQIWLNILLAGYQPKDVGRVTLDNLKGIKDGSSPISIEKLQPNQIAIKFTSADPSDFTFNQENITSLILSTQDTFNFNPVKPPGRGILVDSNENAVFPAAAAVSFTVQP